MSRPRADAFLGWALRAAAAVTGGIVLLIVVFLVIESLPALRRIAPDRFLSDPSWHPQADAGRGTFNLSPMLSGTLFVAFGAIALAAPLGLLAALFCHYYARPFLVQPFRWILETLAGIPSVVYGLWGLVVLVPWIRRIEPPGPSLLAGIVILTLMILPTVALTADAALAAIQREPLRAAAALGLSRAATLWGVVLPAARSSLLTGVILGTGRAVGETMAVLMVCGNVVRSPDSLFSPMRTLTANIALEMGYALGTHRSALFVSGLVLMVMIVALVFAAEALGRRDAGA